MKKYIISGKARFVVRYISFPRNTLNELSALFLLDLVTVVCSDAGLFFLFFSNYIQVIQRCLKYYYIIITKTTKVCWDHYYSFFHKTG